MSVILAGNFAPVVAETTIFDLAVDGHVPEELTERFLRIGLSPIGIPDPQRFHWFTGTGMRMGCGWAAVAQSGIATALRHTFRPPPRARARARAPRVRRSCGPKIYPAASFHTLRHTYASLMAMDSVPLMVVARNLGHADTRMVEKHYGHLATSYVREAIRAAKPLGIGDVVNVVPLAGAR